MRGFRTTVVLLVAGAALSLAVAVALAAPAALSPARKASAGVYCAPGVKQDRRQTARELSTEVRAAQRDLNRFRAAQLKARKAYQQTLRRNKSLNVNQRGALYRTFVQRQNRQYQVQLKALNALKQQLKRAQAQLRRCD